MGAFLSSLCSEALSHSDRSDWNSFCVFLPSACHGSGGRAKSSATATTDSGVASCGGLAETLSRNRGSVGTTAVSELVPSRDLPPGVKSREVLRANPRTERLRPVRSPADKFGPVFPCPHVAESL